MAGKVLPANDARNTLMFIIPSLLGLLFFMAPVFIDGAMSFPLALLAKSLKAVLGDLIHPLVTSVITLTAVVSAWVTVAKPAIIKRSGLVNSLFNVSMP